MKIFYFLNSKNEMKGYYRLLYVSFAVLIGSISANAQTYTVPFTGNNTITTCSGTIRDHAGIPNYSNSANGYTVINPATAGNMVRLTFSVFALECCCDFVRVYDGTGTGGTLLWSGNCTTLPPVITSTLGPLTLQFTSDGSVVNTGFEATISCVAPPPPSTSYLVPYTGNTSITTCTGTIQDHAGAGSYSNSANGYTVINPSVAGNMVQLTFTEFALECCCDYVNIYDGTGTGGALLWSGNCTTFPPVITSTLGPLTVQFTSDGSVVNTGFTANIACVPPCTPPARNLPCGATALTVGAAPLSTDNICSNNSSEPAMPTCWTAGNVNTVWYSFVAPISGYASVTVTPGTITAAQFGVYSGPCASPASLAGYCSSGSTSPLCLSALTPGATYYIVVDGQNNNTGAFTIQVLDPTATSCTTLLGTGVTTVGALPYSSGAGTTCGAVNDLTAANTTTCGSSAYLGGEDRVWVFTAPSTGQISINVTSTGSWTGLMLYNGCPLSTVCVGGAATCVASSNGSAGSQSITACVTAGATYYLVLDVFPSPSCNPYSNVTISSVVPPGSCTAALGTGVVNVASLPYASGAGTTCGAGNDLTASNTVPCGSTSYLGGEDQVFVFTPTTSGSISINLTSAGSFTGLMLYDGCPLSMMCSGTPGSCVASAQSSAGNQTLTACVSAGVTYYLILDSSPAPNCNAYTNLTIGAPVAGCSYTNAAITYAPSSYTAGTLLTFPDDQHSAVVPIGFSFCYYGTYYTQAVVSSNSYISFNAGIAGTYSPWVTVAIPTATPAEVVNTIMFPWQDIDPSVGATSDIRYLTTGVAPNRKFIVNFATVPMFSAACNSLIYTGQCVLNETANTIDHFIQSKPLCTTWNSGNAVHGINGPGGCDFSVVPGRNNTNWTATNDARRFTPGVCCPTILPIELMSFSGENINSGTNKITWESASETNFDRYELEHSENGIDFSLVGTVQGRGTSSSTAKYTLNDNNIFHKTYYRLKAIDKDNSAEYSDIIMVINKSGASALVEGIYPNPVEELVFIDLTSAFNQRGDVALKDITGKLIYSEQYSLTEGQQIIQLDMKGFSKGIYFIEFKAEKSTDVSVHKIIKK